MNKERKAGKAQKVKSFFGYKVNEIEYAIIQSRLAEYIKEGAEKVFSQAENNISTESVKGRRRGHLEMNSWEFCSAIENVSINFEKWLAHETWRRPVKRKDDKQ